MYEGFLWACKEICGFRKTCRIALVLGGVWNFYYTCLCIRQNNQSPLLAEVNWREALMHWLNVTIRQLWHCRWPGLTLCPVGLWLYFFLYKHGNEYTSRKPARGLILDAFFQMWLLVKFDARTSFWVILVQWRVGYCDDQIYCTCVIKILHMSVDVKIATISALLRTVRETLWLRQINKRRYSAVAVKISPE